MKVHKKWIILMAGMTVIAFAGLFATEPSFVCDFNKINGADVAWLITATIFVLMMTPGLSFFYGGMVGAKNVISTMLQSFIAMGLVSVLWVVFGFSLAFGDDIGGVLGDPTTFLMFQHVGADTYITPTGRLLGGATIPLALYALFQMKFAIITPSLITGSFAERVRFSAYLFFMMWFMVFIYCPLAHMTWHPDGLFLKWGVVDFAGGIVVHASSGVAALAGAIFLGRRAAQTRQSQPANIPFVLLGAAMLWLGWFGFNAGSSLHADGQAVKAFLNTNTASATAMMTWIFFDCLRGRKPSAMGAAVGCVVGLVAITPSAGYVTVGQSIFIQEGLISGTWAGVVVFLYHLLAVAIVIVYTFAMSYLGYWLIDKAIPMRVSAQSERVGLDFSQHEEHYGLSHIGEREIAEYEDYLRQKE